jgi:hypothetical protein
VRLLVGVAVAAGAAAAHLVVLALVGGALIVWGVFGMFAGPCE